MANLTITRPVQKKGLRYFEDLGQGIKLEMVRVEGGTFLMGSPEKEEGRNDKRESPQHSVTVSPFCMGRYPITQEQWKTVASFPQSEIELDPDPSRFKGNNTHPVEQINWHEAREFCDRLTAHSDRFDYRLPSEAEWEYACRAGTTTPFHFGQTLTDRLANYRASQVYGQGVKGQYRKKIISVHDLDAPNDFGLCHMHGNVWEWCEDFWHDTYQDAPVNGSAWFQNGNDSYRVLRGGSWSSFPAHCRSASRSDDTPAYRFLFLGFRVVSVSRGTP